VVQTRITDAGSVIQWPHTNAEPTFSVSTFQSIGLLLNVQRLLELLGMKDAAHIPRQIHLPGTADKKTAFDLSIEQKCSSQFFRG
jgi:hypothetical protein